MDPTQQAFQQFMDQPDKLLTGAVTVAGALLALFFIHMMVVTALTALALIKSAQKKWKGAAMCLVYPILTSPMLFLLLGTFSIAVIIVYGFWLYACITNHEKSKQPVAT